MAAKTYYRSQDKEDQWLDRNWSRLGLPDVGVFVEFGAADGEKFSNTWWLAKARGWSGLLCEPDSRHKIGNRPESIVERVCVGPPGVVSLGMTADPFLSGRLRVPLEYESEIRAIKQTDVPSVPLDELLDRHGIGQVDLISIDTEGTELDAWRTLDLNRRRPQIVIMELVTWGVPNIADAIIADLRGDGYTLLERTAHNGIFRNAG